MYVFKVKFPLLDLIYNLLKYDYGFGLTLTKCLTYAS